MMKHKTPALSAPLAASSTVEAELERLNVSRETIARLQIYVDVLTKWQARINLVSAQSLPDIWHRHILDSLQLLAYLPESPKRIMDIGSGAGLPGLLLAIATPHQVHLVESDQRKCAFLRTALREVGAEAEIHNARIETLGDMQMDILTARAVAPLDVLLNLTKAQHHTGLKCLFLKGKTLTSELTSLSDWPTINQRCHASITGNDGQVLELLF